MDVGDEPLGKKALPDRGTTLNCMSSEAESPYSTRIFAYRGDQRTGDMSVSVEPRRMNKVIVGIMTCCYRGLEYFSERNQREKERAQTPTEKRKKARVPLCLESSHLFRYNGVA